MSSTPSAGSSGSGTRETTAVVARMRMMQLVRAGAIVLVLLFALAAPQVVGPGSRPAVITTLAYALIALLGAAVARHVHHLVLLFSALLVVDGVWLVWITYLTGGLSSPLRYALPLHLGAVAIIASYRTVLPLALWQSFLLSAVYGAVGSRAQTAGAATSRGGEADDLVSWLVFLWLVAASASVLSAATDSQLRRRLGDAEALNDLAEELERATDSSSVARTLLDTVTETWGFRRGLVVGGPEGQLPLLASVGLVEDAARRPGRPGASAVIARAHHTRATVSIAGLDPRADTWLAHLLPGASNLLVVPLLLDGRPVGALVLEHGEDMRRQGSDSAAGRRNVAEMERSASLAALALRNAWVLEQVQRLAATDGLTKIANRRTFEATLEREIARATRGAEPVSLVMLDVDHFKHLNDTHGHQAGDEVLRNVAFALTCECRDFDTPSRYGGEEFAVVLPGCAPEEALLIAERLRGAVAAAPSVAPITASAGVATFPTHAGDADTLVRAADNALYESKRSGRDRTTASQGEPLETQPDALLHRAVSHRPSR